MNILTVLSTVTVPDRHRTFEILMLPLEAFKFEVWTEDVKLELLSVFGSELSRGAVAEGPEAWFVLPGRAVTLAV